MDAAVATIDKFYTIPTISKKCLMRVGERYEWSAWDLVVEPSAGSGSFFKQIPTDKKIGIDISPDHKDVMTMDFLTYEPHPHQAMQQQQQQQQQQHQQQQRVLVVGNPPFGRVSSLAVKFFNHASKWASVIAFIVPRTFRRISLQNKLNANFHLAFDEDIPMEPCSFEPPMMAKCCFQIWEKSETNRRPIVQLSTVHADWDFLGFGPNDAQGQPTPPTRVATEFANANTFALRAYGGKCGQIVDTGLDSLRPKSWHWIKSKIPKQLLIDRFSLLDYSVSLDTARQNSIGRGELVHLYSDAYDAPDDAPNEMEALAAVDEEAKEKHEDEVKTLALAAAVAIPFNVTFLDTISNYGFGNVPNNVCIRLLKDGRHFSAFIEAWLEQNYPSLKWIGGCKGHDLEDIADENIKYEQKTFTKGGCKFMPSNMIGVGRKFDQTIFEEKTKKLIFIIVSNIDFPNIKIKFVRGTDLLVNYPDGKIPLKDFDKFFN